MRIRTAEFTIFPITRGLAALALAMLALAGCTTIPEQIQGTYSDISPARVEPSMFGASVRWGGVLIDATNEESSTCFEVLSRDLDKYLRPLLEDRTAGRFIACKAGFHDPEVFAAGREVTLTGTIRNIEVREIDRFNYRYPVVDVNELVLWEPRQEVMVIDHMYDPFWYPYYWGGPYWGGYYPHYGYRYPYGMYGGMYGRSHVYTRQLRPDPAEIQPRQ
jgi:outer membrane lipoprotein